MSLRYHPASWRCDPFPCRTHATADEGAKPTAGLEPSWAASNIVVTIIPLVRRGGQSCRTFPCWQTSSTAGTCSLGPAGCCFASPSPCPVGVRPAPAYISAGGSTEKVLFAAPDCSQLQPKAVNVVPARAAITLITATGHGLRALDPCTAESIVIPCP